MTKHSKKQLKWTWKKPEGKPKRPLSAYNLFYRDVRQELLGEGSEIEGKRTPRATSGLGFKTLTQLVASRWKAISPEDKRPYEQQAQRNLDEYYQAVDAWEHKNMAALETCEPQQPSPEIQDSKPETDETLETLLQVSRSSSSLADFIQQHAPSETEGEAKLQQGEDVARCHSPDFGDEQQVAGLFVLGSSPTSVAHNAQTLSIGEGLSDIPEIQCDPCSSVCGLDSGDFEADQGFSDVSEI